MTTSVKAGAEGGVLYLFSVAAAALSGYFLMEAVARIGTVTGHSLGVLLGRWSVLLAPFFLVGILLGCAAYQAGNLLGAFAGAGLIVELPRASVWLLASLVAVLLWFGTPQSIGRALAAVVVLMGLFFVGIATLVVLDGGNLTGAGWVHTPTVLSLLGTTIVPYNFFLAAGIAGRQTLGEARRGLAFSFGIGWLVTAGIIVTGSLLAGFTDFEQLAVVLEGRLPGASRWLLGLGLLAAGLSSAITAPLAASLATRELIGTRDDFQWAPTSWRFRLPWVAVLATGAVVASLKLNIVYVIFLAQLFNGLLLPLIAVCVYVLSSDRKLLGDDANSLLVGILLGLVTLFLIYQGAKNILDIFRVDNAVRIARVVLGISTVLILPSLTSSARSRSD